jgi:splicing factor 3A subunit 3
MYRGRRAFELHFAEQKHALGMTSLGIPNTKHFHGVTKIEDVQILWNQLQKQVLEINPSISTTTSVSALEEEYEDSHGNVISRATYEELARQGLL